jgi:hypothetical protein
MLPDVKKGKRKAKARICHPAAAVHAAARLTALA